MFGIAGGVFSLLFVALAFIFISERGHGVPGEAIMFFAFAALLGYASAFAAFERSTAIVDLSGASMRRWPVPFPAAHRRGAIVGIAILQAPMMTRTGNRYQMYPIVARFADGHQLTIVDDAGDAASAESVGGRIAGMLGLGLRHGPAEGGVAPGSAPKARTIVVISSGIALALVVLVVGALAIFDPRALP